MANTLRQKRLNQILYISIGSALAVIILFIILLNVFKGNTNKQNTKLGVNSNENNSAPSVEQANSQIGKSINEVEDNTSAENLSIELSQNNEKEDLDNVVLSDNTNSLNEKKVDNQTQEQNQEGEAAIGTTSETTANSNNEITDVVETEVQNEKEEEIPDPVFTMPVEGEIIKQYGKDKLIYSNTLKEWTTHLGIDIKANKTAVVKASSDGVVKSIKNDPRFGLTIVIEHDKGYASIYSNLLSAEFVTVGESVKSGQTIGTVGNTAIFEIVDEPHLHFEITKDGENVDPEMCVK